MITTDDKSGYDHILLSDNSKKYFGVVFDGWVMCYASLPFGFKASCYIYHSISQVVTSYIRSWGMPALCYIDDRLYNPTALPPDPPDVSQGQDVTLRDVYAVVQLLTRLGTLFP